MLKVSNMPRQGGDVALNLLELLVGLLEGLGGLGQLVVGLVEANLELLHLLSIVSDVTISLLGPFDGLPGVLFKLCNGGVQRIRLSLQRLHLLPDCVHLGALLNLSSFY